MIDDIDIKVDAVGREGVGRFREDWHSVKAGYFAQHSG